MWYLSHLQEYLSKSSVIVTEDAQEPARDSETSSLLEFKNLAKFDVQEGMQDAIWSRARICTSYSEYLNTDPKEVTQEMEPVFRTKWDSQVEMIDRTPLVIFGITHNGNVICNIQLQTSPLVLGDSLQLLASFVDTNIPCEQVSLSFRSCSLDDHFSLLWRIFAVFEGTNCKEWYCEFPHH